MKCEVKAIDRRDRPLTGRRLITTSETEITKKNIKSVLKKAFEQHMKNREEILYLTKVYKGEQEVRFRTKTYRQEICNIVAINRAFEIVEFKKGFLFGEPVQLVLRGDCNVTEGIDENVPENTGVAVLNEYLQAEGKEAVDAKLAEDMHVCGTAYRLVFPKTQKIMSGMDFLDEAPFYIAAPDPSNTFIVYSNTWDRVPMLGVTYVEVEREDSRIEYRITAYSKAHTYELVTSAGFAFDDDTKVSESLNGIGEIPIVEYPLNPSRLGCFETVLDPLDAINTIESNRIDGVEQFIQSFLKFVNCDITAEQLEAFKDSGCIVLKGTPGLPADAGIMESQMDQEQTQAVIDDLYQSILTICGVPDREASAGGNTGQALKIGQGWASAETRAKATEVMFKRSERQFINVVMAILKSINPSKVPTDLLELRPSDVDFTFTRNNTDSLLVKTQGLLNLLEAGVHPRIALAKIGLFSDPEQVYQDSAEVMGTKWVDMNDSVESQSPIEEKLLEDPDNEVQENG